MFSILAHNGCIGIILTAPALENVYLLTGILVHLIFAAAILRFLLSKKHYHRTEWFTWDSTEFADQYSKVKKESPDQQDKITKTNPVQHNIPASSNNAQNTTVTPSHPIQNTNPALGEIQAIKNETVPTPDAGIPDKPTHITPAATQPTTQDSEVPGHATKTGILNSKPATGDDQLDQSIETAGYSYDLEQGIFYSILSAWQRKMGYCRLFDEAAAILGMIIDCEPIYFEYAGKRWLIEFWKGQYDLTTGCEIGVYSTDQPDIDIPGIFTGPFFECVNDQDLLPMSYTLKKKGKTLFKREEHHWWLTGFKLGEFSEPWELTVDISITLKDEAMRDAFITGLKHAGYQDSELNILQNSVTLEFNRARTPQPSTRTPEIDWFTQRKNEMLCFKFQEITKEYFNLPDKMKALKKQSPELYELIRYFGKSRQLFEIYERIKKYLN